MKYDDLYNKTMNETKALQDYQSSRLSEDYQTKF